MVDNAEAIRETGLWDSSRLVAWCLSNALRVMPVYFTFLFCKQGTLKMMRDRGKTGTFAALEFGVVSMVSLPAVASAAAQQVTGPPSSTSAATTIDGKQTTARRLTGQQPSGLPRTKNSCFNECNLSCRIDPRR
jgi:hypothetical protein